MKSLHEIKQIAKRTIETELEAIHQLTDQLNDDFGEVVFSILNTDGRVVITGIGKSAIIASKIVATMNSTGTPAIFMHAADAIHGDLGTIQKEDVIICISNSGSTPEIKVLVPILRQRGNKLVAMTGNLHSFLAENADFIINSAVKNEACPNNLAPTSSTTAQLVLGDALAVALLECRGFSVEDFAQFHPGGTLGKKLYLKVKDLYIHNERPVVDFSENVKNVIIEISSKRLGATAVIKNDLLTGIITDGDIRRMLEKYQDFKNLTASDIMSPNPKTIGSDTLVVDALGIMRKNNITQLLVVDGTKYVGVIHLHDILREGII
ncbi:MAG TPA: KpsF/GutQ family sugar-phosphate isomerase [Bacteroidales bacterium]|nr:KpsF/GutQ family sugar-phosphate isomerase [Bacteroidales bacterium]HPE55703.1 KpsF/GutQ family sugar-phosphate isomerase [Bacteroidales bacterium]